MIASLLSGNGSTHDLSVTNHEHTNHVQNEHTKGTHEPRTPRGGQSGTLTPIGVKVGFGVRVALGSEQQHGRKQPRIVASRLKKGNQGILMAKKIQSQKEEKTSVKPDHVLIRNHRIPTRFTRGKWDVTITGPGKYLVQARGGSGGVTGHAGDRANVRLILAGASLLKGLRSLLEEIDGAGEISLLDPHSRLGKAVHTCRLAVENTLPTEPETLEDHQREIARALGIPFRSIQEANRLRKTNRRTFNRIKAGEIPLPSLASRGPSRSSNGGALTI